MSHSVPPTASADLSEARRIERRCIVRLLQSMSRGFTRVYHQVTVESRCLLPRRGPGILVSNHISGLDPLLIQSATGRLIRWMMAREYSEIPGLGGTFKAIGTILVDRNGRDMAATRAAMGALAAGSVVGIFPEGKISGTRQLLPFHPGAAMIALKSHATIYPVYIDGSQRGHEMFAAYVVPQQATLRFGPPLSLAGISGKGAIEKATQLIQSAVADLAV